MENNSNKIEKISELIKERILFNKNDKDKLDNGNLINEDLKKIYTDILYVNENWQINLTPVNTTNNSRKGKIILLLKRITRKLIGWYINPIVLKQNMYNASVTRSLNGLFNIAKSMTQLEFQLEQINIKISEINESNYQKIKDLEKTIDINIDNFKNYNIYIDKNINSLNKKVELIDINIFDILRKLSDITINQNDGSNNRELRFNYFDFEQHFRNKNQMINNLKYYLQFFNQDDFVLDIGCGRGEFLKLLADRGIKAVGIDLDEDMINNNGSLNQEVICTDAIQYLNSIPDNYFNGITIIQMVEHLDINYLNEIIELVYKKLKPEGYLIVETQNPMCLYIYAYWFYVDVTHIRPVHPYFMKYLTESLGFKTIEIKFLSPVNEDEKLTFIMENGSELAENLNSNFEKLNNLLYGYQDYAIISKKLVK